MSPVHRLTPLSPQTGGTFDPRNAVGRAATLERAREDMRAGSNLSLSDARRMGKTVLLDLFCAAPGDGFLAVKVDYEGVGAAEEFLLRTIEALNGHQGLPKQARAKFAALFENVELSGPASVKVKVGVKSRSPADLLRDAVSSVGEHLPDGHLLVIAMDEVPLAVGTIADKGDPIGANQLLQTLRSLRSSGSRLRWILCGSVGFHHVLHRCGATEGAINDLVDLPFGPLAAADADELAERLLLGIQREYDAGAVGAMRTEADGIPFYIHGLAHHLRDNSSGRVSAEVVTDAFADYLDDVDASGAATHLVTRLDPHYGEDVAAAEDVLDRLAREQPASVGDFDAKLLRVLQADHYLARHRGEVRWRYDVLRRIWVHRRGL